MRAWRGKLSSGFREVTSAPPEVTARPRIGFVGAGHVGTALAVAFSTAGWPVTAAASRSSDRRRAFEVLVPGSVALEAPPGLLDLVDILFVTVPDDAIATVVTDLRLYSGQSIVHTSGLLPSTVLAPALAAGSAAASFHPLVAFADVERAVANLPGAAIALEGDQRLVAVLAELAEEIGARPVLIETAGKAAYHVAAVLAAGGFVGLLDAISTAGREAGLDEPGTLAIYGSLIRQSLANAEALGIDGSLTGPIARGDAGTVGQHLAVVRRLGSRELDIYRALGWVQLAIAERRGGLAPETVARLRALLANSDPSGSM